MRSAWRGGEVDGPLAWRRGLLIGAVFVAATFLWAGGLTFFEALVGVALRPPGHVSTHAGVLDALWHVATAFVLVLPVRDRHLLWIGPGMALGFDVDHVFGFLLPTPFARPAHTLVYVTLVTLAFAYGLGRTAAGLAPGVALGHMALDGGGFPLFAPLSSQVVMLSYPEELLLLFAGEFALFVALRSPRDLKNPRTLAVWLGCGAVLALLLAFVAPQFFAFIAS